MGDYSSKAWRQTEPFTEKTYDRLKSRCSKYQIPTGINSKTANVLLLGANASGKSSLCNTLALAFSGNFKYNTMPGRLDGESYTHTLRKCTLDGSPFTFYDTQGLDGETITLQTVEDIMDGKIKEGYHFDDSNKEAKRRNEPAFEEKIHVILLVVAADTYGHMKPELMTFLKGIVRVAHKYNREIPIGCVLTKIDLLGGKLDKYLDHTFKHDETTNKVNKISADLCLPRMHINPIMNYHDTTVPNLKQNILALMLLEFLVHVSDGYMKTLQRIHEE